MVGNVEKSTWASVDQWKWIWFDIICPSLLTLLLFFVGFHVWEMDVSVPIIYAGSDDFTHGSFLMRALRWESSIWTDDHLGYPYEAEMYAFPHVPYAAVVWGYILGMFTDSYGVAVNTYILLTYILATVIFSKVSRSLLDVSYSFSLLGGLLYSFSFYHLIRTFGGHFTAICYGMVPLVIWLCVCIASSQSINWDKRKKFLILLGLMILCLSDPFYSFWACMLLFIAGLYAWFNYRRTNKNYIVACISIVAIVVFTGVLLSPAIYYALTHHVQTANRTAFEAWWWGLNLPSLFAPTSTEHNPILAWVRNKYLEGYINSALNTDYLGIWGIIGFFYLVYRLFHLHEKDVAVQLARFNVWTLFIGVSGGIGLFVAVFFTAKVRVYDRISVYVYCFSVLAFLLFLKKVIDKYNFINRPVLCFLLCLIVIFHLYDMQYVFHKCIEKNALGPVAKLGLGNKSYYRAVADSYEGDRQVVDYITKNISPSAHVLYLPYLDFPEEGKVGNYVKAVGVRFFSKDIYISSGNVYGTYNAEFMRLKYDTDDFNQILTHAYRDGFDVIMVDKSALKKPDEYVRALQNAVHVSPVFETFCYSVFVLDNGYQDNGNSTPVKGIYWLEGIDREEKDGKIRSRWARKEAYCQIISERKDKCTSKCTLKCTLRVYGNQAADIKISGCGRNEQVHVPPYAEVPVELKLDLSQGDRLKFTSSVQDKLIGGRKLNFMVRDYRVEE